MAEIGSSAATLVSNAPTVVVGEEKIQKWKRSYVISVGAVVCAVSFIIATGLLADQVARSGSLVETLRADAGRQRQRAHQLQTEKDSICTTKDCVVAAASLAEAMDPTADPCQDFFQFACGGWIKKNGVPDGRGGVSSFGVLSERIYYFIRDFFRENNTMSDAKPINSSRDMYQACMNTDEIENVGLTPLVQMLNTYGSWPMTVTNWTEDSFDWLKTTAYIRSNLGESYLIAVANFIDVNNTDRSVLYVDQPSLAIPKHLLLDANLTTKPMVAYATFISGVAMAVRDASGGLAPNAAIVFDVQELIRFEISLAKILTPDEERSWELSKFYKPLSLPALQDLTDRANSTRAHGRIDWFQHLSDIYSPVNVSIERDERLIVIEPQYFARLVELMDATPPRVIANYIHWRMVLNKIHDTNLQLNVMAAEFRKAVWGMSGFGYRWRWCMNRVYNTMGYAVGARFIEKTVHPKTKSQVQDLIGHLKIAFSSLVEEADWMDEETKIRAKEKAAFMREYIGYPDWVTNRTALELAYRGIEATDKRHFENFRIATEYVTRSNLKFLRFRTDRNNLWISFPAVVNAFYWSLLNSITFPVGILQPPFYAKGRLAAMNYGSIGVVIGHEITHGFDHHGHKSDKDGHQVSWWTNRTLDEFYRKKQCFIDQYGNYTFPQFEGTDYYRINGTYTQGENIADNGGLREAFRAYTNYVALNGREPRLPGLEQYSAEQIFFISYANTWCGNQTPDSLKWQIMADPHSPARYRVIGPLSNSKEFAEHFQCAVGVMNRQEKCILW